MGTNVQTDASDFEQILDLSNRDLSQLPVKQTKSVGHIVTLNVSGNRLRSLRGLRNFKKCTKIVAKCNRFCNFATFSSVHETLRHLDLSNNEISSCDLISTLTNLITLDLSHNQIKALSSVTALNKLQRLNVSFNSLCDLPDVKALNSLVDLDVSGNQIVTLIDTSKHLPVSLKHLNLASNLVNDLTEAVHLKSLKHLEAIDFANNPCVCPEGREFCYRPFLCYCCFNSLKVVDEVPLNELEVFKGEMLYTEGKRNQMKTNASLCAYLTVVSPLEPLTAHCARTTVSESLDPTLCRIYQMRRKYTSESAEEDSFGSDTTNYQSSSPYHSWLKQVETIPDTSDQLPAASPSPLKNLPQLSLSSISSSCKSTITHGSPDSASSDVSLSTVVLSKHSCGPPSSRNTTPPSSSASASSSTTFVLHSPPGHSSRSEPVVSSTNNTQVPTDLGCKALFDDRKLKFSGKQGIHKKGRKPTRVLGKSLSVADRFRSKSTERPRTTNSVSTQVRSVGDHDFTAIQVSQSTQTSVTRDRIGNSLKEYGAAVKIQKWWRVLRPQYDKNLKVCEIHKFCDRGELFNSLEVLKERVDELSAVNEQTANIVADMTNSLMAELRDVKESVTELTRLFQYMLPTPVVVEVERKSPFEICVTWQDTYPVNLIKGYSVIINGKECGIVKGISKKVSITELNPNQDNSIVLQCISKIRSDVRGGRSEEVILPAYANEANSREYLS